MQLLQATLLLLGLTVADVAFAKNCIWTNVGLKKDVFVWDSNVEVWSASHYWNWHYDNLLCFKNTWNFGNGLMTFGINDGERSIGFLYSDVLQGTSPDTCFTNSCTYVDAGGKSLADYIHARAWRTLSYCTLNQLSCVYEATTLKTGEACSCQSGVLVGGACFQSGWIGLNAGC
ncbi:hypothetical protein DFJ73DRAFT_767910 [Zopfochytrium polystomum]|nr:hypothetical protein DFJ73DRAFT_767910 [Zopfochytrium polystomum]